MQLSQGLSCSWSYGSWIYNYLCLSPLMLWVWISISARCTTLCGKVCQWLATGRWFSPCPPVSSTNKIDRHDITDILFESGVKHHQTNKQNIFMSRTTVCSNIRRCHSPDRLRIIPQLITYFWKIIEAKTVFRSWIWTQWRTKVTIINFTIIFYM